MEICRDPRIVEVNLRLCQATWISRGWDHRQLHLSLSTNTASRTPSLLHIPRLHGECKLSECQKWRPEDLPKKALQSCSTPANYIGRVSRGGSVRALSRRVIYTPNLAFVSYRLHTHVKIFGLRVVRGRQQLVPDEYQQPGL
jgi:hypothetical protein